MSWILDVLDYVPVVGAVKNGIEAGIHCYNGNGDEAKSKALQCVFSGVLDIVTLGAGGTIVKVGGQAVIKGATKVVSKEASMLVTKAVIHAGANGTGKAIVMVGAAYAKKNGQSLTNQCGKGGTNTQTQTNSSSKKDTKEEKKQEKDKKDEDEPKKNPYKDDKKKGGNGNGGNSNNDPKRGHHVINNGILSLYGDIIETFLTTQGLKYRDQVRHLPQEIVRYHDQPLPENTMTIIGQVLVIQGKLKIKSDNSDTYGTHNTRVIRSTVRYMQLLTLRITNRLDSRLDQINTQRAIVEGAVNSMINDAFVDNAALNELPSNQRDLYELARNETIEMLNKIIKLAEEWVKLICSKIKLPGDVTFTLDRDGNGFHYIAPK